ncbi:hypothetical protein AOX55_00005758 (plasmid) [Sinorhizobium fredii CCBAU 25509]|nr:hypothetical protein SF83666_b57260 [Sinorhizobium fredii CCBAU 83666]AWM28534.1 hypothetical protein AOX55_00005758 [Sinorhizobium fredii CCBAU 25509]
MAAFSGEGQFSQENPTECLQKFESLSHAPSKWPASDHARDVAQLSGCMGFPFGEAARPGSQTFEAAIEI